MSGQTAGQMTFFAPVQPRPRLTDAQICAEFDETFWPAWRAKMNRPNNPRQTAMQAFYKARRTASLDDIMDGLDATVAAPDPTMRPMAATWLNQQRYRDDPPPDLSADPWGLDEFIAGLPDTDGLSAASYEAGWLGWVLAATGWPMTWRGDLAPLNAWLVAGYQPVSIAAVIRGAVADHGTRSRLAAFDGIVRVRADCIDLT
jgi:hypothetical protein